MTEQEWLACTNLQTMLNFLRGEVSDRKYRLFACAWGRKLWSSLTDARLREAVEVAERFLQGRGTVQELESARLEAMEACGAAYERGNWTLWFASQPAFAAVAQYPWEELLVELYEERDETYLKMSQGSAEVLREIVGNPFRPVSPNRSWLLPAVHQLAQVIHEDCRFDGMLPLADALEEAGCDDEAILSHCRGPGLHVKGCWVIDLLLGKE